MIDFEAIKAELLGPRHRPGEIPRVNSPGLYALFLESQAALPGFATAPTGLLYIGKTGSSLHKRNHFRHRHSAASSPRRSLGALLKQQLELQALPRNRGRSEKDFTHYRFSEIGEEQLTKWMHNHLNYTCAPVSTVEKIKHMEQCLIAELLPPLNLTGWLNPRKQYIEELRAVCCDEARTSVGDDL